MTTYRKKEQSTVLAIQIIPEGKVEDAVKLFGENPVHFDGRSNPYIIQKEGHRISLFGVVKPTISAVPIEWGDYIVKENDEYKVMSEKEFLKLYEQAEEQEPNQNEVIHQVHHHFNINVEELSKLDGTHLAFFIASLTNKLEKALKNF